MECKDDASFTRLGLAAFGHRIRHPGFLYGPGMAKTASCRSISQGKNLYRSGGKNAVAPTSLLSAEQFKTEVWHQEKPPLGSFNNLEQLVGRVTATSILPGDLITEGKLAPKGSMQGITALLSPNQRAMTVKVDEASGVAGFLTPGTGWMWW